VCLDVGQYFANPWREPGAGAGDDREGVVERGAEGAGAGDTTGPVRAPLLPLDEAANRELAALLERATVAHAAPAAASKV